MSLTKTLYFELESSSSRISIYTKKSDGEDNDENTPYDANSFTFKNIKNNIIYICEMFDESIRYTDTFKLYSPNSSECGNSECSDAELENADIENADIENADIENADIENADIENAAIGIKVIGGAISADGGADDYDEDKDDYCHPIGNIICQLEFDENFKRYFHTNFDKLILKIQSQIYNNGLFKIELSPEEEESLRDFVGLPNKVIKHMQDNCESTYFMVVFDVPDVDAAADELPDAEAEVPDINAADESNSEHYEDDTWILRQALLYPTH
jgi:hypothetical protein